MAVLILIIAISIFIFMCGAIYEIRRSERNAKEREAEVIPDPHTVYISYQGNRWAVKSYPHHRFYVYCDGKNVLFVENLTTSNLKRVK